MVGRLRVEDCNDDTPLFRSKMTHLENATNSLEERLKAMAELSRQRFEIERVQIKIAESIADEVLVFAQKELDDDDHTIQQSLVKFAAALKSVEVQREMMSQQTNTALQLSFEKFLKTDLSLVKESRDSYHDAQAQLTVCCAKFAACKKQDHLGMIETAKYVHDAKVRYHKESCQYAMANVTIHAQKKIMYLEKMLDVLNSQMAFFQLGSKALQPLEPLMKDCFDQLKSMKSSFAEMQQQDDADYDISVKKKAEVFLDEYIAFQINDLKKDSDSPNMRKRSTTEVTKSGYLFVGEKKQFGYTWDRSYFYIIDGVLMRQSNHTVPPSLVASLEVCTVKPEREIDRNYCFNVISPQTQLVLQAESKASMVSWIGVLNNAIAHSLNNQRRRPSHSPTSHMTTLDPSGVVSDGIDRTADMLPILSAIMTNSPTCADCGEPGADWVSINIGVVICIQCSGIHRSLGVIISQVRSLTLDAWKPGMLTILTHTDNQRVNEKYEHIKPHHGDTKPTPDSPRDDKESWIRQKYVDLVFMRKPDKLQILEKRKEVMERNAAENKSFQARRDSELNKIAQDQQIEADEIK